MNVYVVVEFLFAFNVIHLFSLCKGVLDIYKALHCGILNEATAPISIELFSSIHCHRSSLDQCHSIVYQSYPVILIKHCIVELIDERTAPLRTYILKSIFIITEEFIDQYDSVVCQNGLFLQRIALWAVQ